MINNQYKSKHESKKASVAVYKQKLQPDGRKSLEASPGLTYKNSNVPRKIEFSTLVGLPHQGEGSDLCTWNLESLDFPEFSGPAEGPSPPS